MNRDNQIDGRILVDHQHPLMRLLPDGAKLPVYSKSGTVVAIKADNPGVIDTPEGTMTFQAGDYIVTDNPPSHAWPVRETIFEATYVLVGSGNEPKIHASETGSMMGIEQTANPGYDVRGRPESPLANPGFREEARQAAIRAEQAAARQQKISAPRLAPTRPAAPRAAKGK